MASAMPIAHCSSGAVGGACSCAISAPEVRLARAGASGIVADTVAGAVPPPGQLLGALFTP
jgi:hypothetical protein